MSGSRQAATRGPLAEAERIAGSLAKTLRGAARNVESDAVALESALRSSLALVEELMPHVQSLRERLTEAAEAAERQFLELESVFREQCLARGWKVDGHWPDFYIERAIPVNCDARGRTVAVAGKKLAASTAAAAINALEPMVASLLPKRFSASDFVDNLAAAYDAVKRNTDQASVLAVYREMVLRAQDARFWKDARSESFRGLSADQFRARLTASLENGVAVATGGRELRLLPPLDASDGMFIYQPAEARFGFVGRIQFLHPDRLETR